MASIDFDNLAHDREEFATSISDLEVARQVIKNVLELSEEKRMKVDILLSAVPDIGTIFAQLKYFNKEGTLTNQEFHDILEICIEKYHKKEDFVNFNPLTYKQKSE